MYRVYKFTLTLHPSGNLVFRSLIHFSSCRSLHTLLPLNIFASTAIRTSVAWWSLKCLLIGLSALLRTSRKCSMKRSFRDLSVSPTLKTAKKHCACECCSKLVRSEIRDTTGAKSYHVQEEVDCSTRNVIYCLLCSACGKTVYIGETERWNL